MSTFTYPDTFNVLGVGINGATVNAYKASRFSSAPALNASPPSGSADATATTATSWGSNGAFAIALPTSEDYYISVTNSGTIYWKGPVYGVYADGTAQGGSSAAGISAPLGGSSIIVDPGGTAAPGFMAQFSSSATAGSLALGAKDHLGNLIGGVGTTGGWKTFGDRTQAGTTVTGPFIALDGTTNPPSVLYPSVTYGAGFRIWGYAGTPATSWGSGTTNVGDLWYNSTNQVMYQCIISGAGTGPGTWIIWGGIAHENFQTGTSYTLQLTDIGLVVDMFTTSANTVTVPPTASITGGWPTQAVIEVAQVNTGVTTITPGAGVTINSVGGNVMAEWVTVSLRYRGGDVWLLTGATT